MDKKISYDSDGCILHFWYWSNLAIIFTEFEMEIVMGIWYLSNCSCNNSMNHGLPKVFITTGFPASVPYFFMILPAVWSVNPISFITRSGIISIQINASTFSSTSTALRHVCIICRWAGPKSTGFLRDTHSGPLCRISANVISSWEGTAVRLRQDATPGPGERLRRLRSDTLLSARSQAYGKEHDHGQRTQDHYAGHRPDRHVLHDDASRSTGAG